MKLYNLGFIGFGNVGRALARLLVSKSGELRDVYGIKWRITGVASRKSWLAGESRRIRADRVHCVFNS